MHKKSPDRLYQYPGLDFRFVSTHHQQVLANSGRTKRRRHVGLVTLAYFHILSHKLKSSLSAHTYTHNTH